MACITKHVVRIGVIGALATGAAVVIAGPDRVGALFTQTRSAINDKIDKAITDPVALRAQLRDLESQYPKRISEVRGDLAELREQKAQIQRDIAISGKVVALADGDRDSLLAAIDQAQAEQIRTVALQEPTDVVIAYKNGRIDISTAQSKADQAAATSNAYSTKCVELERNLDLLAKQESRLVAILEKLESERTNFQAQLWTIDQEVDAIARNERMIAIVGKWQQSIDEQSRYKAGSLDQVRARLADVRARQEAKLDCFAQSTSQDNYEQQARLQLDREAAGPAAAPARPSLKPARRVIEIHPEKAIRTDRGAEASSPSRAAEPVASTVKVN
ncbi:MAG: hypothetical protein KF745_01755 [Phycisphaeraceae bacterium]|nr:hypothetical protein [Phycisphaeraceae bacterium]